MKLPNADRAIIDPRKLTGYALSPVHDDGKHKATLFSEKLGVTSENVESLEQALRVAAAQADAAIDRQDKYGQRYVIDFDFTGPKRTARLRSAWIIRIDEALPRLITCYIL